MSEKTTDTAPKAQPIPAPSAPKPTSQNSSHDGVLQFFTFAHLADKELRDVSEAFSQLAHFMVSKLPRNPERTKMLNKLLEAKDCAVRAKLYKEIP